jgi:arginase family enzyme
MELFHYIAQKHFIETTNSTYTSSQLGSNIKIVSVTKPSLDGIDIVLVGCGELRGQAANAAYSHAPDIIREELYKLHYWHKTITIGDIGNIVEGQTLNDTRSALKIVLQELHALGKKVIVLGGSHDLTLQQYEVFKDNNEIIDFSVIDMLADINEHDGISYDNYLMNALTASPNYVRHFNLIGFQSYFVNPTLIETLDKLRFDCIRVGKARENLELLEPVFRGTHLLSIDINAVRYSDAPANKLCSPNGFYGDEMCALTRFAGMSNTMSSLGIYGYMPEVDNACITAKLIAQMIWYYIDGVHVALTEADINDKDQFMEYHISFTDVNTFFIKSKRTNRWWMKLPNDKFIACSYDDYIAASNNEIPERWMREVERLV